MNEAIAIKNKQLNAEDNLKRIQKMKFHIISNFGYICKRDYLQNFTLDNTK